jgi:hypothetical protein
MRNPLASSKMTESNLSSTAMTNPSLNSSEEVMGSQIVSMLVDTELVPSSKPKISFLPGKVQAMRVLPLLGMP